MRSRPPTGLVVLVLLVFVAVAGGGTALVANGHTLVGDAVFVIGLFIAAAWYFWIRARYFR